MEWTILKSELKHEGLGQDEIRQMIRSIDDMLLDELKNPSGEKELNLTAAIGVLLCVGGILVTAGTYLGWIDLRGYVVFAYGPILGGLGMIIASKRSRSTRFDRQRGMRK